METNMTKGTQEQGSEAADSNHDNKEEPSELLLVGEDRMYPTLRSKSLNTNPRKMRMKHYQESPRSAGSVRDLVSVFSEQVQDQGPGPEVGTAGP